MAAMTGQHVEQRLAHEQPQQARVLQRPATTQSPIYRQCGAEATMREVLPLLNPFGSYFSDDRTGESLAAAARNSVNSVDNAVLQLSFVCLKCHTSGDIIVFRLKGHRHA
jgi:hypothetical protein